MIPMNNKIADALLRESIRGDALVNLFNNNFDLYDFRMLTTEKLLMCIGWDILTREQVEALCSDNSERLARLFLEFKDKRSYDLLRSSGITENVKISIGHKDVRLFCKYNIPFDGVPSSIIEEWYRCSGREHKVVRTKLKNVLKQRILKSKSSLFIEHLMRKKDINVCFTEQELIQIPTTAKILMRMMRDAENADELVFSNDFFEEIKKRAFMEVLAGRYKNTKQFQKLLSDFKKLTIPVEKRRNSMIEAKILYSENYDVIMAYSEEYVNYI